LVSEPHLLAISLTAGQSGEGRKQFFFEKKARPPCGNQKTFAYWARACGQSEG
jgi:hypothetical protein